MFLLLLLLVDALGVFSAGSQPYLGGSRSTYGRINHSEANAYPGSGWCHIAIDDGMIKGLD